MALFGSGFVSVRVRVDVAPCATVSGANCFCSTGAASCPLSVTVSNAGTSEAVLELLLVTGPVWLQSEPGDTPLTSTTTLHEAPTGITPPSNDTLSSPGSAVRVPPQSVVAFAPFTM
jgi:hypothetical protein